MSDFPLDMRCWRCGAPADDSGGGRGECLWPPEGENRVLTMLFPDLCGYMAASRQAAGEDAVLLVNAVLDTYIRTVLHHGGFIARCIHDEVLALFGTPVAREDDPERAVVAALEIRCAIQAMGLNVKVGINSGLVYFGPVGNALHSELSVVGPAADVAARMAGKGDQAARPGEILVGSAVYEQTRDKFTFGPPRRLQLKGIRDEVVAYDALDHAPANLKVQVAELPGAMKAADVFCSAVIGELDALELPVRQLLQVASVVGTAFDRRLLALFVPCEDAFRRYFNQLAATSLVHRDPGCAGDERYVFRDGETRKAIYATLLRARRGILHQRIADGLEALIHQGESVDPEEVAGHRSQADACAQPVELASGLRLGGRSW